MRIIEDPMGLGQGRLRPTPGPVLGYIGEALTYKVSFGEGNLWFRRRFDQQPTFAEIRQLVRNQEAGQNGPLSPYMANDFLCSDGPSPCHQPSVVVRYRWWSREWEIETWTTSGAQCN